MTDKEPKADEDEKSSKCPNCGIPLPPLAPQWVSVPREPTPEMIQAMEDRQIEGATYIAETSAQYALWKEVYAAMLAALPAAPKLGEPKADYMTTCMPGSKRQPVSRRREGRVAPPLYEVRVRNLTGEQATHLRSWLADRAVWYSQASTIRQQERSRSAGRKRRRKAG